MSHNHTSEVLEAFKILQKHNLQDVAEHLRRDARITTIEADPVAQEFMEYKANFDDRFEDQYQELINFMDTSLDVQKPELNSILYPVFVQMYLRLVSGNMCEDAARFLTRFRPIQEDFYQEDIDALGTVRCPEELSNNASLGTFRASSFVLSMSREAYQHLKRFLQDKALQVIHSVVTDQLDIDVFDGPSRSKLLADSARGSTFGEARRDVNRTRVLYGPLREPDVEDAGAPKRGNAGGSAAGGQGDTTNDGGEGEGDDAPKKKKAKKDGAPGTPGKAKTGSKQDQNGPPLDRIPLPELTDADMEERRARARELLRRVKLGRGHQLPTICMYTVTNAGNGLSASRLEPGSVSGKQAEHALTMGGVTCVTFTEDNSMMAFGTHSSNVEVYSLVADALRELRSHDELDQLDKEDPRFRMLMMVDKGDSRSLMGHNGAVLDLSFSPDRIFLVSASTDATVRLWCTLTWTTITVFRVHETPVPAVRFSPARGHYFVTGSQDTTARLLCTDQPREVRQFTRHNSDVTTVEVHPNANYVATGCADRGVRLFDCLTGKMVRLFTGHKGIVQSLCFSHCGRYLASGCCSGMICLWDISNGLQVGQLEHGGSVCTLCYDRDAAVLVSGGNNCTIKVWDVLTLIDDHDNQRAALSSAYHCTVLIDQSPKYLLGTYRTKSTPVLRLHFTRRNLLLAVGPYEPLLD